MHDEIAQTLAERWCWQVAYRDDTLVARHLYHKQVVDAMYWLDAGALLDDCLHSLEDVEGWRCWRASMAWRSNEKWSPSCHMACCGIESMHTLLRLLFSDEVLRQLVGFNAQLPSQGICQRWATTQPGERLAGPICPETLAKKFVKLNVWKLEILFHGAIRLLAKTGVFNVQVTGMADGTNVETTTCSFEEPCSTTFRPTSPASSKSSLIIRSQHRVHGYVGTSAVMTSPIPTVPQNLSSENGLMSLNERGSRPMSHPI